MPGKPGTAEQFAGRPALLCIDGDNRDPAQGPMRARVARPAAKYLGQGSGGYHDTGAAIVRLQDPGPGHRIPGGQLDQPFGIKDQSAA